MTDQAPQMPPVRAPTREFAQPEPPPPTRDPGGCRRVALILAVIPVLFSLAVWGVFSCRAHRREVARRQTEERERRLVQQQRQEVRREFEPLIERLGKAAATARRERQYDIDKTMRVIHEIEIATSNPAKADDFLEFLRAQEPGQRDYQGVAPDVIEARKEIIETVWRLYGNSKSRQEQEQFWRLANIILSTLSIVGGEVEGSVNPGLHVTVDRAQAQELLDRQQQQSEERARLLREMRELNLQLEEKLEAFAQTCNTYVEQWHRLCLARDRAYQAASQGEWALAIDSADRAIAMAPGEREAKLLKAMAMIRMREAGRRDPEGDQQIADLLDHYVRDFPGRSAPALLLLGNLHQAGGDYRQARAYYEQAAAYYPREADRLADMLDPYRVRAYLRKTPEGSWIIEQYRAIMQGAGYFSPELQRARMYFATGDNAEARKMVLHHFARRRTQEAWDFVISDVQFCEQLMGREFERIFPRDVYLDLVDDRATFSKTRLDVAIRNRSGVDLDNCTLLLCLNVTDMYPEDYQPMRAGDTVPLLPAGKTTRIGSVEVDFELFGRRKTVKDINTRRTRAILISNTAVCWVDTTEFKQEALVRAVEDRRRGLEIGPPPRPADDIRQTLGEIGAEVQPSIGRDHLRFRLPAALAELKPTFRLKLHDRELEPSDNDIQGNDIQLRFKDVADIDRGDLYAGELPMKLVVATRWFDIDIGLNIGEDGELVIKGVEPPEAE